MGVSTVLFFILVGILALTVAGIITFIATFVPTNGIFGPVVWRKKTKQLVVALTFDDGPQIPETERILDILDQYQIKATFFLLGENAQKHPDLVRRIAADGHAIGNHSYSHSRLVFMSAANIRDEILKTDTLLHNLIGTDVKIFRPPHGVRTPLLFPVTSRLGYTVVTWSITTADWLAPPPDRLVNLVLERTGPGDIVLFHDGALPGYKENDRQSTVAALPHVIEGLRAKGYSFVTIPELLQMPPTP